MQNIEFPMYIAEVNVEEFFSFRFKLPAQDIGRNDVMIYVEYDNPSAKNIWYNVYGQIKDSYIRAYLCSSSIPGSAVSGDVVSRIIFDLNSSKEFYLQVANFIDHFGNTHRRI